LVKLERTGKQTSIANNLVVLPPTVNESNTVGPILKLYQSRSTGVTSPDHLPELLKGERLLKMRPLTSNYMSCLIHPLATKLWILIHKRWHLSCRSTLQCCPSQKTSLESTVGKRLVIINDKSSALQQRSA